MLNLVREIRDQAFALATFRKDTADVEGVILSLDGVSPRMRYVMSRGYESEDAQLAAQILEPGDKVLEAGSAVGFLAIYCAKLGIKDYCLVEANGALAPAIRKNFKLNGVPDPHIISAAVSAQDGEVLFGVHRNFWSSSVVKRDGAKFVAVPARSIPSIIAELPYRPNVLVMDIEGGEASIPYEHFDLFDKLLIEMHPKLVGSDKIADLTAALVGMGFIETARIGASRAYKR